MAGKDLDRSLLKRLVMMKRIAMLLSVENYKCFPVTKFCHADANLLRSTLIDLCDFRAEDVIYFALENETPSPAEVIGQLEDMVNNSSDGDTIVFYFAGHGVYCEGKINGTPEEKRRESFLIFPHSDPNNLAETALGIEAVSSILRKHKRICVRIFDACQSGHDVRSAVDNMNSFEFTRHIFQGETNEGWMTFAGCREDESSHHDPLLGQGIFTHSLCKAIQEVKPGTTVLPEIVKVRTCQLVEELCKVNNYVQTPKFNSSIAGNVAIALRRNTEASKANVVPTQSAPKESLEERIERARDAHRPVSEVKGHLQNYIARAYDVLKAQSASIPTHGKSVNLIEPTFANRIPDIFVPTVVNFVKGRNLVPLHYVYKYEKRKSGLAGMASALIGDVEYDYSINQYNTPINSYVGLKIENDEVLPEAQMMIYVLPLQTRTCILTGVAFLTDKAQGGLEPLRYDFLDYSDDHAISKIDNIIRLTVERLITRYVQLITSSVAYIESEASQE